jgi:hypothetical protein
MPTENRRQTGYVIISKSGPTVGPISVLPIHRSRPTPASFGRGYRKILLFDEAALFVRRGYVDAWRVGWLSDLLLQDSSEFPQSVLNLSSIHAAVT